MFAISSPDEFLVVICCTCVVSEDLVIFLARRIKLNIFMRHELSRKTFVIR